ncbi:MAG TPA: hypothetical protein VGI39_22425 [Polyangiaceae bacterium]
MSDVYSDFDRPAGLSRLEYREAVRAADPERLPRIVLGEKIIVRKTDWNRLHPKPESNE